MKPFSVLFVCMGKGTAHIASAGLAGDKRNWAIKQERRTPGYTTFWVDMPIAQA